MAAAPQVSHSSGNVFQLSLQMGSRVEAEPDVAYAAQTSLSTNDELKGRIRGRQDAEDHVFRMAGKLNAAERRTGRELMVFANRLSGAHASSSLKGEKSPYFRFVFAKKNPSDLLPHARLQRTLALEALAQRIGNVAEAGAQAAPLAVDLFHAMAEEKNALERHAHAVALYAKAREQEDETKRRTVAAVRAMINEVQKVFAEDPGQAREILGHSNPAAARKAKKLAESRAAKLATEG